MLLSVVNESRFSFKSSCLVFVVERNSSWFVCRPTVTPPLTPTPSVSISLTPLPLYHPSDCHGNGSPTSSESPIWMCMALWLGYYLGTTEVTANKRLNSTFATCRGFHLLKCLHLLFARQRTFNVDIELFRRNVLPCFSPFTMQCTSFDCVPENLGPPCQSEEWTPPSGPPPHPPSCKIVGHVDACLQRTEMKHSPFCGHCVGDLVSFRGEGLSQFSDMRKHQQTNWKLACNLCFSVHYKTHKSLPARLQRVLWRPAIGLYLEAPYWLTLVFPPWFLGVAMVTSPPLRPCTRWRAAAVFSLSQTFLPAHWARRFPR